MLAITVSVGQAMAGKLTRRPGAPARLRRFHETSALVTLGLIAGHAGLLLGDRYLHPGLAGITIPFAMHYQPQFTGIGIIAGWLAAILGLSFYVRRRIGAKLWRFLAPVHNRGVPAGDRARARCRHRRTQPVDARDDHRADSPSHVRLHAPGAVRTRAGDPEPCVNTDVAGDSGTHQDAVGDDHVSLQPSSLAMSSTRP